MKRRFYALLLMSVFVIMGTALYAQPGGGGGQGQGGPPPGGTGAPVDGGAVALVIGAAAYGYKQFKTRTSGKVEE